MDTKSIGVGVVATLLVLSTVGAGAFIATGGLDSNQSADTPATTTESQPQETVSEDEVPDDVKDSSPAAKELKQRLMDEGYDNSSVSITRQGEIVVSYSSEAGNGEELKNDMAVVAKQYAAVAENETGGLTVAANGVKLMVSSDAAIAYDDGKLNDEAFEKTFHWGTVGENESDS